MDANNQFHAAASSYYAAYLRVYLREYEQAGALTARALGLCDKHHFPQFGAYSRCILGRARAELGCASEGLELIRQGIANLLETGARSGITRQRTYLAEAQEYGDAITADAIEAAEEALQFNPDELVHRPEALRVRGEIQLMLDRPEPAETDFRDAIALAQSMSAKAFELRASISLARLLASTNRRAEAYTMLSTIYNWFTEGFDTADLKDAKALLDELSV